ncbi:MAG: hypothetical protein IPM51_06645 [Sphingobacteriaceae bacterium]|nr:hypothetical protein [Sphingobacteriaceae bacterium]
MHIRLPDFFTVRFHHLIAAQRSLVNELLEDHVILSYSLDIERKNLYVYIQAKNQTEVMDILSTFPIIKEVKVEIHELAFFNSAPVCLPELSLN